MDWHRFFFGDAPTGTPATVEEFRQRVRGSGMVPRSSQSPQLSIPAPALPGPLTGLTPPGMAMGPFPQSGREAENASMSALDQYRAAQNQGGLTAPPAPPQRPANVDAGQQVPVPPQRPADLLPASTGTIKAGWSNSPFGSPLMMAGGDGEYETFTGPDGRLYAKVPQDQANGQGVDINKAGTGITSFINKLQATPGAADPQAGLPAAMKGSALGNLAQLFGLGGGLG